MLTKLLLDLAALPTLAGVRVIVTLNLFAEPFDSTRFEPLQIDVLRNEHPRGFGANHNAAFAHCETAWFAILNPDLRVPHDPFASLFEAAMCWPDAALLGPRVMDPDGNIEDSVRDNLSPLSLVVRRLLGKRNPIQVSGPTKGGERFYWIAGMFMLLRTDAFRSVGGFDERYFMYCEDYDLCARMYVAGYSLVLVSQASVVHAAQRDSHRSLRHLRWHLTSICKAWCSLAYWKVSFQRSR
jgi:GT2 family glycosyltransferase